MSDAFAPPESDPADLIKTVDAEAGDLPAIGDLFSETMDEFSQNLGPYALAGLAYFLVTLLVTFGGIFLLYAGMFAAVFGGIGVGAAVGGDAGGILAMLISVGGFFVSMMLFMAVILAILMPMNASLERAVRSHLSGEGELGFGSPFSTIFQDFVKVVLTGLLVSFIATMGVFVFYIGVFIAAWLLFWATSRVALDRKGPVEAIQSSLGRVWADPGGAGALTAVCFVVMIIAGYVPIVGPMFGVAFKVRAHAALFPTES